MCACHMAAFEPLVLEEAPRKETGLMSMAQGVISPHTRPYEGKIYSMKNMGLMKARLESML